MLLKLQSNSLEETLALGKALGEALKGGETLELVSDLGGGKTSLVKGIAAGLGSKDVVQSPSFTISRVYKCKNDVEVHHFDFYRLTDPGIMTHELHESLGDDKVVVVIEWADIVDNILPDNRIRIAITATGDEQRQLDITLPEGYAALDEALSEFKKEQA